MTETVTLDMLGPAHGGTTVGRLDGRVVFVRGALPEEKGVPVRLDPAPTSGKKRFLTGEVVDPGAIAAPSAHRVAPVCAAAAAGAGCCDLDIVDRQGSLDIKARVVREQFERIGGIGLPEGDTVSPEPFTGYRTRVRLGVDADGRAGLRRRGSNGVLVLDGPATTCAQWAPALADGLAEELAQLTLTPGAEVCVAVGDDGERGIVEVPPVPRNGRRRGPRGGRGQRKPAQTGTRRVLSGSGTVNHTVDGVTWRIPVDSFWQAHQAVTGLYAQWVRRNAPGFTGQDSAPLAWDLYGGAGVFAAALSDSLSDSLPGLEVESVDVASASTGAGQDALAGRNISFVTGDVAAAVSARGPAPAAVVLDPPRTGAGEKVIAAVADRRPACVLQIGCDPATAARDGAALVAHGYRPDAVTTVDAFGLTHHVEVLLRYVPADSHA